MTMPRQMTSHCLEALKGWPSPHAVDFAAPLHSSVLSLPVFAGRVVHLEVDSNAGNRLAYVPGIRGGKTVSGASLTSNTGSGAGGTGQAGQCDMPIFLFQNSDDPDTGGGTSGGNMGSSTINAAFNVSPMGGDPALDFGPWVQVTPTGKIMGLVAAGAYEMQSTEYASTANATSGGTVPAGTISGTYAPGDGLTTVYSVSSPYGGLIVKGTAYTDALVGVVSRGEVALVQGAQKSLTFWPVWLPMNSAKA